MREPLIKSTPKERQDVSRKAVGFRAARPYKSKIGIICTEFLLYVSIGFRVFGWQIGILKFQYFSGAIVAGSGLICLLIMIFNREKLPFSFVFILLINIFSDISEFNALGLQVFLSTGPKDMLYWLSWTLMACYIVREDRAGARFCFFLAFCILVSVALGGKAYDLGGHTGLTRFTLEGVGTMFANANALSQVAAVTAIAFLFRSLRSSKVFMLGYAAVALSLSMVALRTISRQGLILLAMGLVFYIAIIIVQKRGKLGFIIFAFLCLFAVNKFSRDTSDVMRAFEIRLNAPSTRTEYFRTMLEDMGDTLIIGKGSLKPFTVQGIQPHNTFLYLHVAYGGLCAWTYALWVLLLTWRTSDFLWKIRDRREHGIEVLAFLLLFLAPQLVNVFAPGNFGNILALATIEKSLLIERLSNI